MKKYLCALLGTLLLLAAPGSWADGINIGAGGSGSGCTPSGSSTQVLTDNGTGGCTSNSGVTISGGNVSTTSVNKVTITPPATGSTVTVADGKVLTISNTLTLTGTDTSSLNIQTGGTLCTQGATPAVGDIAVISTGGSSCAITPLVAVAVGKVLVSAGTTTAPAYSATPQLGASGTTGSVTMGNGTSGLLTIQPVTGALGNTTLLGPVAVGSGIITQTIATGSSTINPGALTSGSCNTTTTTATGAVAGNKIDYDLGDLSATTGYSGVGTLLTIYKYTGSGNVNWRVCNWTGSSITPSSITAQWSVHP